MISRLPPAEPVLDDRGEHLGYVSQLGFCVINDTEFIVAGGEIDPKRHVFRVQVGAAATLAHDEGVWMTFPQPWTPTR